MKTREKITASLQAVAVAGLLIALSVPEVMKYLGERLLVVVTFVVLLICGEAHASTISETYQYGDFTVSVATDGSQAISGGVFDPPATPPLSTSAAHTLFVDYSTNKITYYQKILTRPTPIIGYAVITPDSSYLPSEIVEGTVTAIDMNPWWCPTANVRKIYPDLPSGCLSPGHALNAMGSIKFIIHWQVPSRLKDEWSTIRLHGSRVYPEGRFWDEDTAGCTRLLNEAIEDLVKRMGPNAVAEGIRVVLMRGTPVQPTNVPLLDVFGGD